jgi:hypothetical protein
LAQSWKRQFGIASQQQPKAGGQQDAKAIAAAALEAAKAIATTDQYGRAVVTETRKFAGQSVQVPDACQKYFGLAAGSYCPAWEEMECDRDHLAQQLTTPCTPRTQIKKSVAGGSAAKDAEKKATTGLDAMLEAIQGAKKV